MSILLKISLHCGLLFCMSFGAREVYNIAHMTNTLGSLDWALGKGANGVEVDLTFDTSTGNPLVFRHSERSEPCDCTCMCPAPFWSLCKLFYPNSVCAKLLDDVSGASPCIGESSLEGLLASMAGKSSLALVVIDSKINGEDMNENKMTVAGQSVANVLETYLFENGYGGKVILGSPKLDTLRFLRSAVETLQTSPYKDRVFFTVDMEKNNIVDTLRLLHTLPTNNIVYGTGTSACSPSQIKSSTMQLAAINRAQGVSGLTYLWTVDRESTIRENLQFVEGIMSNYPGKVFDILQEYGLSLATQSSSIPEARRSDVISSIADCDCDYHPGGCTISSPAPVGLACHCVYKGFWTCGGTLSHCSDPESNYCKRPDYTVHSCVQGGGDCNGYRTATCDCDYHPGGCSISQAPPPYTACKCLYKGFWTCGGEITRCRDENSYFCRTPDTSFNTCLLGGGDCDGY